METTVVNNGLLVVVSILIPLFGQNPAECRVGRGICNTDVASRSRRSGPHVGGILLERGGGSLWSIQLSFLVLIASLLTKPLDVAS
jgi:hypothetical protein